MPAWCMKQTASWYCSGKLWFFEEDARGTPQLQGFLEKYSLGNHIFHEPFWLLESFVFCLSLGCFAGSD